MRTTPSTAYPREKRNQHIFVTVSIVAIFVVLIIGNLAEQLGRLVGQLLK